MNTISTELPERLVTAILDNIRVEGAQPVTISSIRAVIAEMLTTGDGPMATLSRGIINIGERLDHMDAVRTPRHFVQHAEQQEQLLMAAGILRLWPENDRMHHHVPDGFRWPRAKNTMLIWNYWFFGDNSNGIGPYKFIPPHDDLCTRHCKTSRSRAAKVISTLVSIAVDAGKVPDQRRVSVNNK